MDRGVVGAARDISWMGAGTVEPPLSRKRFVLTGKFPDFESVGETELQKGKKRVTAMIRSFGGEVTTAISG